MSTSTITKGDLAELVASGRADLSDPEFRALARRLILPSGRSATDMRFRSCARFRAAAGGAGSVSGVASVYGLEYGIGHGRRERIAPGAFARSLQRSDGSVILTYLHEWTLGPIGVARAWESGSGLHFDGRLFLDSDLASRVYRAVESGSVTAMSIGYIAETIESGGPTLDIVTAGDLLELAVVLRGANPAAHVAAN